MPRRWCATTRTQGIDDARFGWLAKGLLIDPTYRFPVIFSLFPDLDHDGTFPSPITVCPFPLL
jgi:hypothetical protein